LSLPQEVLEGSINGTVRLKFVSYRSGKLFRHKKPKQQQLEKDKQSDEQLGMVITASVSHRSVSGLKNPVIYSMPLSATPSFYSCVYWDEHGNLSLLEESKSNQNILPWKILKKCFFET